MVAGQMDLPIRGKHGLELGQQLADFDSGAVGDCVPDQPYECHRAELAEPGWTRWSAARLRRMRELTRAKSGGELVDTLLAEHGLFHLGADLRYIDLIQPGSKNRRRRCISERNQRSLDPCLADSAPPGADHRPSVRPDAGTQAWPVLCFSGPRPAASIHSCRPARRPLTRPAGGEWIG
jgi:hypothetical protein